MSAPATVAPAVRMSEGPTSPASVSLTDNDDLLLEIFLRLPPLPSAHSPSASAGTACFPTPASSAASALTTGRLLCLAYSPTFSFVPFLSPPDQIPSEHFRLPQSTGKGWHFYGCRHGLAAFLNGSWTEACVWEPFTGSQRRIPFPQGMKVNKEHAVFNCAVLSAMDDTGDGYLHSEGYLSQFKFTLIFTNYDDNLIWACLYDSQSGEWGNISSIAAPSLSFSHGPSVLVGNALYWYLMGYHDGILEFDLERQHLAIIHKPEGAHYTNITSNWVLRTEDGELGLAKLSTVNIQLWGRKAISNGAVGWVLQKTIELDKLLSLTTSLMLAWATRIVGYDEDSNVIFLLLWDIVFTIQLESMQFKKVSEDSLLTRYHTYYPYRSF